MDDRDHRTEDGMMRKSLWVLLLAAGAACGGDSSGSNQPDSPYNITVINPSSFGGNGNPYVTSFTLEVTLKDDGSVQSGVTIITQTSVGDVATLPLVTGVNGRVSGQWTIQPADQVAGRTEVMAYCAPNPGGSFCKTKLNGPDRITVTF